MVLVMKLISLAFDLDKGMISRPNILEYFGYSVSVSSVIFGPFMTYTDYCQILVGKRMVSNSRFFSAKFILERGCAPSLTRFLLACSISALPGKGKKSAATQQARQIMIINGRTFCVLFQSFFWFLGVIRSCFLSYCCLIISACVAPWIFEEDSFK